VLDKIKELSKKYPSTNVLDQYLLETPSENRVSHKRTVKLVQDSGCKKFVESEAEKFFRIREYFNSKSATFKEEMRSDINKNNYLEYYALAM